MPAQACESSWYREPIIRTRFNQVLRIIVANYSAEEIEEIGESSSQLHLNRSQLLLMGTGYQKSLFCQGKYSDIIYLLEIERPRFRQYAVLSTHNPPKALPIADH